MELGQCFEADFPDELGADLDKNDVDGDIDGDFFNNTIDLDDDYDSIFDWFDVDDDNDGLWDYFEVDTNDDLDDDTGQNNGNFFSGSNCIDNDDDGMMQMQTVTVSTKPFGIVES